MLKIPKKCENLADPLEKRWFESAAPVDHFAGSDRSIFILAKDFLFRAIESGSLPNGIRGNGPVALLLAMSKTSGKSSSPFSDGLTNGARSTSWKTPKQTKNWHSRL